MTHRGPFQPLLFCDIFCDQWLLWEIKNQFRSDVEAFSVLRQKNNGGLMWKEIEERGRCVSRQNMIIDNPCLESYRKKNICILLYWTSALLRRCQI